MQIILQRRAAQYHPTLGVEPPDGRRALVLLRLEPVALVRNDNVDVHAPKLTLHLLQPLVAHNHDTVHAAVRKVADVGLAVGHKDADALAAEPLCKLLAPVVDERDGAHDERLAHHGAAAKDRVLLHQRPQQSNGLQRLAEPHLVGENGALPVKRLEPHHGLVQELHALALVRPQVRAHERVHDDIDDVFAPTPTAAAAARRGARHHECALCIRVVPWRRHLCVRVAHRRATE